MQKIMEGGCHCGRCAFGWRDGMQLLDLCEKGFISSCRPQQFQLLSGKHDLTTYEFNTGTAKHTFCKYCGIHPFYVLRSDPDKIDINVRCLDGIDLAAINPKLFDGIEASIRAPKRLISLRTVSFRLQLRDAPLERSYLDHRFHGGGYSFHRPWRLWWY